MTTKTPDNSAPPPDNAGVPADSDQSPDSFVPDPQVWQEFGITAMGGWRWTHDPDLKFPPPIKIRNRSYRSRKAIEYFKQRMIRQAIADRSRVAARRP